MGDDVRGSPLRVGNDQTPQLLKLWKHAHLLKNPWSVLFVIIEKDTHVLTYPGKARELVPGHVEVLLSNASLSRPADAE